MDFACNFSVIEKSGTWFSSGDQRLGQGREAAKKYILEHDDFRTEVQKKVGDIVKDKKELQETRKEK